MRNVSWIVAASACLLSLACAPEGDIEEQGEASAQESALSNGTRVCKGAFFDRHPVETVFTDSTGTKHPMPYAACDTTSTIVLGTADYAKIAARTAGSGFSPVRIAGGKAVVALYLMDFGKSDVGSYREIELTYAVQPDAVAAAVPEIPWVNELSAAVPLFLPGVSTFMDLSHVEQNASGKQALRFGAESVGLDKRAGDVKIGDGLLRTYFDIDDENGKAIVSGHVSIHRGLVAQLLESNKLAKALGLPNVLSLPKLPSELVAPLVNVDQQGGNTWQWAAVIDKPKPIISSLNGFDKVEPGASSEIGGVLRDAGFEATAAVRHENADLVYTVPAGWN